MRKIFSLGSLTALLLTLITGYYYLRPGFFDVHDPTHIGRVVLLWESLKSGQIPALWASSANHGFGYPLFHFYAPAFYYLVLFFKIFSPTYLTALKISVLFLSYLGTLGMYRLTSRWGRGVALISAVSFALVPYRAITLYVRGSYAEFMAIMLLPWVLLSFMHLKNRRGQLSASLLTSLFVLSHNLIPLIAFPFIAVWALVQNKQNLKRLILPFLFTLTLTAFYSLPIIFERDFVQLGSTALSTEYQDHFVTLGQLWNSTWGFGGSAPGLEDGISFKLGKLHIILAIIGSYLLYNKAKKRFLLWFMISLTAISAFMMTQYSESFWDMITPLQYVQFPWRYMALATFGLSFLAGFSVSISKNKFIKFIYLFLVSCYLLLLNLKYFAPQELKTHSDSDFASEEYLSDAVAQKVPEYLPVDMSSFPTRYATPVPDTVDLDGPSAYTLDLAYYPTWEIKVDGESVDYFEIGDGLVGINLTAGPHTIEYSQSHTDLGNIASIISLISLVIVGYWYVRIR